MTGLQRISGVLALLAAAGAVLASRSGSAIAAGGVRPDTGFVLTGSPEAPGGATWSYRGTVDGVAYDLTGVLLKPPGKGPFPAVILSHGLHGNASAYGVATGRVMVGWGVVCIAVNYTHASGVPLGAPGGAHEGGASGPNLQRAQRTYELLRGLGYVDMTRVAAHGNSMGAFVTEALVAAHPDEFRVASHTAGGVRPPGSPMTPAPLPQAVSGLRTPYQMHHGGADQTVPLSFDQRLDSILTAHSVPHQLYIYPGERHMGPSRNPVMFQRVHDWYAAHGLLATARPGQGRGQGQRHGQKPGKAPSARVRRPSKVADQGR